MKLPAYIQKPINALLTTYFRYVLIVVVVAIGALGYFMLIRPQFENVRLVGVLAYQNATDRLFDRQRYYSRVNSMVNKYHEVSAAQTVQLEDIMPTKVDNSALFRTLQALSQQAGMNVVSMALSKGTALTTTSGSTAAGTATNRATTTTTASSGTVRTINVTLTMTGPGDYETYKKLLTTIEQSMRIFDLGSISFNAAAASGTQNAEDMPSVSLELKTYYLDQASTK
jgi:hypothetical protein